MRYALALLVRQLGVLRGVIRGFSEEARTRGFPSPSFGGFDFVVCCVSFIRRVAGKNLIVNITGLFQSTGNVSFGSLADHFIHSSPTAAFGRIADTRQCDFESPRLYVRFQLKRSLRRLHFSHAHRLLSANSGRSLRVSPRRSLLLFYSLLSSSFAACSIS